TQKRCTTSSMPGGGAALATAARSVGLVSNQTSQSRRVACSGMIARPSASRGPLPASRALSVDGQDGFAGDLAVEQRLHGAAGVLPRVDPVDLRIEPAV